MSRIGFTEDHLTTRQTAARNVSELSRKELITQAETRLREAGVETARNEVSWLLQAAEGVSRARFVADMQHVPSPDARGRFTEWVERRREREPFQYIVGEAEFFGRTFAVGPGVLIPRPETETLVERGLELVRGRDRCRVWDVGTGSGVIAITMALEHPNVSVLATDISEPAVQLARTNAGRLDARVDLEVHDMRSSPDATLSEAFDLVISNPPYVPYSDEPGMQPEVLNHEPRSALFSGEDPLHFYRALARLGATVLKDDGILLVEVHVDHASDVAGLFTSEGYSDARVMRDLFDRDRVVSALLRR